MTRIKRPAVAAASAALLVFSLSACGGPPTDASEEEFCEVVNDPKYFEGLDEDADEQDYVDAIQDLADDIRDVGTPESISDDAREGFEIQLDAVDDLDADDIDFDGGEDPIQADLDDDEKKKVDAYQAYEDETCEDNTDIGTPEDDAS